ncbi:Zinc finger protein 570 [Nymphon striatum]|nr:Zinc finger protein 570 [Nymphon striatum]
MMMDKLNASVELYGMRINEKKTKVMKITRYQYEVINITLKGRKLEQVRQYKYLGSILDDEGKCTKDVKARIAMAKQAFMKRKELLIKNISLYLKKRLVKSLIWSVALYGSETWTIRVDERSKLEAFEMWVWRNILKIKWSDKISNEDVLKLVDEERAMMGTIHKRQRKWIGHILRSENMLRDVMEGHVMGRRQRGRQRIKMLDGMKDGKSYAELKEESQDRNTWRILCDLSTSYCGMDFMDGSRTTVKSKPKDGIHQIDINSDPAPTCLPFEVRTIKIVKPNSQGSVLELSDCSTQKIECEVKVEGTKSFRIGTIVHRYYFSTDLVPNSWNSNSEIDIVDCDRTTIKNEPEVEIHQNTVNGAFTPDWLSFEIETVKEENKNSGIAVIESSDSRSHEIKQENEDEDFLGETYQNVMCSTFSSKYEKNVGDLKENPVNSKCDLRILKTAHTDKCNFGLEYFTNRSNLTKHTSDHSRKKPFECNICYKCFAEKGTLNRHMRIHTNEKSFECEVCHKCFSHSGALISHLRVHTDDKPFKCEVCHKGFTVNYTLTRHMRIHSKQKPFECNICSKCFIEKGTLNRHMRIHTNEKPFECEICHKCFGQSCDVIRHMHIHTNEKPFKCKVCHKSFTQKVSLRRHKLTHVN